MNISSLAESKLFRGISLFVAANTAYIPSALGIGAVMNSIQDAIRQMARIPHGHYTVPPGEPYLGTHPARALGRGIWSKRALANAESSSLNLEANTDPLDMFVSHTVAVAPAPGGTLPWEGGVTSSGGSGTNSGNGNRLYKLNLISWKSRGLNIDYTIYHNSETNYNDELGYGWTSSTDIYINNLTSTPTVHWPSGTCIPYSGSGPTFTPPAGIYDQLVENTGGTWTLTKKNGLKYQFNAAGFCTAIQDLDSNQITFTLNSSNYCTKITDPTGKYLTINVNVNGSGQVTSIVDPLSRQWTFTINGSGDLSNVAWPTLGGTVYSDSFSYTSHRISSHTDKRGNVWGTTYNSDGSVATETDPLSHSTSYSYTGSATTVTDPLGHSTVYNYSGGILASIQDKSSYSESYTSRDANYNVLTLVDKNSHSWTFTYDSKGNRLSETNPISHTKSCTFNSLSQILTSVDGLSNTTTYTYSAAGRPLTVTDPLSHVVKTNTYDSYGELLTTKDALNNTTQFVYDSNGNPYSRTDPLSKVTTATYDSLNRLLSSTDPLSHTESVSYDAWGRATSFTHADTTTASKTFDAESNIVGTTDENGHSATYAYDAAGRETSATNARSDSESYGYDSANRRTTVTDGKSHTRSFTFTNRGEVATLTLADGDEEQWAYDGNGNVTAYTNPLSQTVGYVFDNANRQTAVDYPSGTDTSLTYDNANRPTSMVDATGTTSWGYDNASRLTSLSTPQGNMTYTYDNAGKRATMVEGVGTTTYGYDADSRVSSIQNPYSETTSISYDNAGRLAQKTFASGQYDVMGYDSRNRITSLSHKNSSGTVLSSESYGYDYASNMTSKTVDSLTTTYTFDAIDQLLTESNSGYSSTFTYDANRNRATQVLNGTTYSYSYDNGDKLSSIASGGSTIKSYTYDGAGRTHTVVTSAGTTTLGYDYEDRVTGITYPSTATNSFTYNGLDTRVGKVDSTGTSTYKHDGTTAVSPVLSDGSIAYTPGISERKSGATTYDLSNFLGSFTRQTNASQTTTSTRIIDAFGNLESSSGTPQSPFGFAGNQGYQEDGDSGLKLLGHRYYDSGTGRFLTRDRAMAGSNWYTYCNNNPLKATDRSGLEPELLACEAELAEMAVDDGIITAINGTAGGLGGSGGGLQGVLAFYALLVGIPIAAIVGILDGPPEDPDPQLPVYRVGDPKGTWWSPDNPMQDPNYYEHHGMRHSDNSGTVVTVGTVSLGGIFSSWFPGPATDYDGNSLGNGYSQIQIPNPGGTVNNPVSFTPPPGFFK